MKPVLSHDQVWKAIDGLGSRYGLTPSALARKAGLDPTTFNRSKRQTPGGRERWPSTESIAKVLQATGASLEEFIGLTSTNGMRRHTRPLLRLSQAGAEGYFDESGHVIGDGWDEIDILADADEHSYALEISGDSMSPLYRDGDIVVVSPSGPGTTRRPCGRENHRRRSHGAGVETPDDPDGRTGLLQPGNARAGPAQRGGELDRAHRLGQSVGSTNSPDPPLSKMCYTETTPFIDQMRI